MVWKNTLVRGTALMVAVAALLAVHALTAPSAVAADFSGERITIIVPFREGGGSDTYARFLSPFLRKHLPGNPTIVVRNIPGAGSIAGANQFEQRAKPDGLTILVAGSSAAVNFALGDPRVKYKLNSYRPILLSPFGAVVYAHSSLGLDTSDLKKMVEQLRSKALIYGGFSPTSADNRTLYSLHMLGVNPKTVWGLRGRGPARLAFERGEFNINYDTASAYVKRVTPLVKSGKAVPLFSMGLMDESGKLQRDPVFPNIPHLGEVYQAVYGKDMQQQGAAYKAWEALFVMGTMTNKSLMLPAATPDDIVDTFIRSARNMLADPEFQKASQKHLGAYPQLLGSAAARFLKEATTIDPVAFQTLEAWLLKEHNTKLSKKKK